MLDVSSSFKLVLVVHIYSLYVNVHAYLLFRFKSFFSERKLGSKKIITNPTVFLSTIVLFESITKINHKNKIF